MTSKFKAMKTESMELRAYICDGTTRIEFGGWKVVPGFLIMTPPGPIQIDITNIDKDRRGMSVSLVVMQGDSRSLGSPKTVDYGETVTLEAQVTVAGDIHIYRLFLNPGEKEPGEIRSALGGTHCMTLHWSPAELRPGTHDVVDETRIDILK
jgi:hypothetical protein